RLPLRRGQELDQIPLLFGYPPSDGSQLDGADSTGEVDGGLAHATNAPLERLLDEPPVEDISIDRAAAGFLIGGDQLVDRADPADLERCAEAPRLHAEPGQVLDRVAQVHQLPVDGGGQASL